MLSFRRTGIKHLSQGQYLISRGVASHLHPAVSYVEISTVISTWVFTPTEAMCDYVVQPLQVFRCGAIAS